MDLFSVVFWVVVVVFYTVVFCLVKKSTAKEKRAFWEQRRAERSDAEARLIPLLEELSAAPPMTFKYPDIREAYGRAYSLENWVRKAQTSGYLEQPLGIVKDISITVDDEPDYPQGYERRIREADITLDLNGTVRTFSVRPPDYSTGINDDWLRALSVGDKLSAFNGKYLTDHEAILRCPQLLTEAIELRRKGYAAYQALETERLRTTALEVAKQSHLERCRFDNWVRHRIENAIFILPDEWVPIRKVGIASIDVVNLPMPTPRQVDRGGRYETVGPTSDPIRRIFLHGLRSEIRLFKYLEIGPLVLRASSKDQKVIFMVDDDDNIIYFHNVQRLEDWRAAVGKDEYERGITQEKMEMLTPFLSTLYVKTILGDRPGSGRA